MKDQEVKPYEPLGGIVPGLKYGNSRTPRKRAFLKRLKKRRRKQRAK